MTAAFGHRNTGRAKQIGGGILAGLAALGEAAHDGPIRERIAEIDGLLPTLRKERDYLINSLYEQGDLRVSDDFDPMWRPEGQSPNPNVTGTARGEGRLTICEGSYGKYDRDRHPGCPYPDSAHGRHEFTLRD